MISQFFIQIPADIGSIYWLLYTSTTDELIEALIEERRDMNRMLNIPLGIKNYGEGGLIADTSIIDEKEFLDLSLIHI